MSISVIANPSPLWDQFGSLLLTHQKHALMMHAAQAADAGAGEARVSEAAQNSSSSNGAPSPTNRKRDSAAAVVEAPRYAVDLVQAFPAVCQRARSGVQVCHAVAAFVQDHAANETTYGRAMLKLAQNAKAEDWATQLSQSWALVQATLEQLAVEHSTFAATMQSTMVTGVKAFATQQEVQVQRLVAEGTKVRAAQQQMQASLDKAKEKYDRKCAEAMDLIATSRRSDSADGIFPGSPPLPSYDSMEELSSREVVEKLSAGAGQLLTKMWDSTSSFGKSPQERQRNKLDACLEEVINLERQYLQAVELMNAQRLIYDREIKENLHAFQLTEEQRIEYLKDLLVRMQKASAKLFQNSVALVNTMKESTSGIDEFADIVQGFKELSGSEEEVNMQDSDLSSNPYYERMEQVQSMADRGHNMLRVVMSAISELISIEDYYTLSLHKLLRFYDSRSGSASSDTNTSTDPNSSNDIDSMNIAWKAVNDQVQRLIDVHQEFSSLLAEPVSLSLRTMRQEYENARNATQENFIKSHSILCGDSAAHMKLAQKLDGKSKEISALVSTLPNAPAINSPVSTSDVEQVIAALQTLACHANERDRRIESKLRHLCEELRELQQRVKESGATLKTQYHSYIQDVEVFVSVYMKNEKYRIQVGKGSLQSFARAFEHMAVNGSALVEENLVVLNAIDADKDVVKFIERNKMPPKWSKRVVPVYHNNDSLKDALNTYYQTRTSSSVSSPTADERRGSNENGARERVGSDRKPSFEPESSPKVKIPERKKSASQQELQQDGSPGHMTIEDRASPVAVGSDEDKDVQPLAVSDFQKKFQLENPEQVVESYSCALYVSNFPCHGRLYLTRDHLCFNGWRDTVYVASYLDIAMMEKKNTALIVPNAIELTVNGEKIFIASFVFRDECYQCIQQLQAIKIGTAAIMGETSKPQSKEIAVEIENPVLGQDTEEQKTSSSIPASAPANLELTNGTPSSVSTRPATPPKSAPPPPPAAPKVSRSRDAMLNEYEVLIDEEAHFSVDTAYSMLWIDSSEFLKKLLDSSGETNVVFTPWGKKQVKHTSVEKPETFDGARTITYNHNKKYMVGPSTIPTTQVQRYKWHPGDRLIVSITSTVTDVPYCDYFRAESRWVYSATKREGRCLVQMGLRIVWLKSTWLKKQIEGTAVSEAKEWANVWLSAAIAAARSAPKKSLAPANDAIVSANAAADTELAAAISTESSVANEDDGEGSEAASEEDTEASSDVVERSAGKSELTPSSRTLVVSSTPYPTILQIANGLCVLMFIYTMYRICYALEQMQALTRETLAQQQQQQEVFKQILQQLQRTR